MSRWVPTRPPFICLVGLAVMAWGVVVDVGVHLTAGPVHDHGGFSPSEHGAHAIVLLGMVLTLAGVVIDGTRRQLRRRGSTAAPERSSAHAIR